MINKRLWINNVLLEKKHFLELYNIAIFLKLKYKDLYFIINNDDVYYYKNFKYIDL